MGSRYPRTCRGKSGPHLIESAADERPKGQCIFCSREHVKRWWKTRGPAFDAARDATAERQADRARWVEAATRSGRKAVWSMRSDHKRAEERDRQLLRELRDGSD